jgi:hypothetical protein
LYRIAILQGSHGEAAVMQGAAGLDGKKPKMQTLKHP